MSVFIVNQHHINVLVTTLRRLKRDGIWIGELYFDPDNAADMQCIGQALLDENYRSYCSRYSEEMTTPPFVYKSQTRVYAPVQVIKAAHCYEYQAIESPTWETSLAREVIDTIVHSCGRRLPGYDEAAWEIQAPELVRED
jgi:hypothetical protein